ncbi:MAG: type II toxin-antitoxin system YafQ family toxin [Muribaculaceae bacterium]|nr:type II toxin-antitoxin system YafQ family toxin [Muribaculaceae bacterium]MBQ7854655.1 type II toxin-antitoxin system YafQ family toxin [Muribaculaceae bacterium]
MKYDILFSNQFKRSYKRCIKRGYNKTLFEKVITILSESGTLPPRYKPHKLTGEWAGLWECHIQPDWLLIWEQRESELILILTDTGTHSDLFG